MDLSADTPETEELSFGPDSVREPEPATGGLRGLGSRLRASRVWRPGVWKPIAAAASMGLLIVGAVADGPGRLVPLLPPPDGPWPETGTFSAFLCDEKPSVWRACQVRESVPLTDGEKAAIEVALAAMPEVTGFRFETREEAFANLKKERETGIGVDVASRAVLDTMDASDMPESYRGELGPGDWRAAMDRLENLPGVSNVSANLDSFWEGKADAVVAMCPRKVSGIPACEARGRATESEEQAVSGRIRRLPGVEKLYFANWMRALREFQHSSWKPIGSVAERSLAPDAFYVKLADPSTYPQVEEALTGMAGVAFVKRLTMP